MVKNIRESMEGAGIGLLGGLLMGISDADWLRLTIALAILAYTGGFKRKTTIEPVTGSYRHAFTGISATVALIAGLYLNGHQTLEQSPKQAISALNEAGFSPDIAKAMYLKQFERNLSMETAPGPSFERIIEAYFNQDKAENPSGNEDNLSGEESKTGKEEDNASTEDESLSGEDPALSTESNSEQFPADTLEDN